MTPSQDVAHQLQALALGECASLQALRRVAQQRVDPTANVVLALVARDIEQDRTLLQRIVAGALDALDRAHSPALDCQQPLTELNALSRTAATRARQLRELACSERHLDHLPLAMLLEAMASDSDKHARLLQFVQDRLAARARAEVGPSD